MMKLNDKYVKKHQALLFLWILGKNILLSQLMMFLRWWGEGKCEEFKETSTKNKELEFHNVAGIFVVLGFGALLGLVVAAFEYCIKKLHKRHKVC